MDAVEQSSRPVRFWLRLRCPGGADALIGSLVGARPLSFGSGLSGLGLKRGPMPMIIEIHRPELERRVRQVIQSGRFQDADELLTKALDALSETSGGRMGALDWSQCPAVETVPDRLNGAWVFRDTRMPVSAVFENLEDGATIDEITEWYRVSKEQVLAVLEFAAHSVAAPVLASPQDAHPV